jgi:hypothetical protein
MDQWEKGISDISGSLSPNQRRAFQRVASQRSQDFDSTLARHAATEIDRGKEETTNANLDAERSATLKAYADPTRVQQGIDHQKAVITLDGHSRGQSPEVINQRIAQEVSQIHSGVINLLLADDKDIDAAKYFQAHAGEMDGKTLLQTKDRLDLGSARGESQRQSDQIIGATATLGGALQEAAKIADPKVREMTEERIRRSFEDKATNDRQQRFEAFQRAGDVLEQTGSVNRIPPADWLALSVEERAALQRREDRMHGRTESGEPKGTSDEYIRLLNMAGLSDQTRAQFMATDLSKSRGKVSDAEFKHLLNIQLSYRTSSGTALSNQSKLEANAQEKARAKAELLRQTWQRLGLPADQMPPGVPGGPLRATAVTPLTLSPKGKQIPKDWVDRASRDPKMRRYYEHMGVIFDSTAVHRTPANSSSGDIILP